jgi:hypothetical protein
MKSGQKAAGQQQSAMRAGNIFRNILCAIVGLALCLGVATTRADTEEFAGPFPSWRNLKTDYGAVGDGRADDTAALQHALDDLVKHRDFCVLYIPAGRYRLTKTVKTLRVDHNDCQGVAIVGESPDNTVLQWDGPSGQTVFAYDAWYSKISRLTIDGAGRAHAGLVYGPTFSTYNETSDMVFRNLTIGLMFGGMHTEGQAENEVLRCRFIHCSDSGLQTLNFNSMDVWVWYCRFEDCGHGLFNCAGNFHAWQNLFLRSSISDIGSWNLMVFSFVNNTSIGSKCFLNFDTGHTWGSPMTISGNRILQPTGDFPLRLGNGGPYLVMDNLFKLPVGSSNRAAKMTWGDQTFVGNTYTSSNAVVEAGRFRRLAENVIDPRTPDPVPDPLPPTPERQPRKIIEVHHHYTESAGGAIQHALDEADQFRGQRPIVHIPVGIYNIYRTLVIPAESDVQLVGDSAGETGTRLNWAGAPGGLLLNLKGPTRATLRDLFLNAPESRALLVGNADQPGGKIFADQFNVRGPLKDFNRPAAAVFVNDLGKTDVLFRCLQGEGDSGAWVEVAGPSVSAKGTPPHNQISIFTGGTGSAESQYDVHDGGRLVARGLYHEKSADTLHDLYLYDSGMLAIDASRFSCLTSARTPMVTMTNFSGLFTMASSMLMPVDSTNAGRFEISGANGATKALALNDLFWVHQAGVVSRDVWVNHATAPVYAGLIGCNMNSTDSMKLKGGFGSLADLWTAGSAPAGPVIPEAALLEHLAPLREARVWLPGKVPAHATDLQIYRVFATGGPGAVVEFRAAD